MLLNICSMLNMTKAWIQKAKLAENWYAAEIINQQKYCYKAILKGDRHKILILKKGKNPQTHGYGEQIDGCLKVCRRVARR